MIFGIGIDVLQVERVERVYEKHGERFVRHLLLPEERAQLERTARPVRFLAMRFAAKEAIVKGMGTGFAHGVWIRDVGIVQNSWGKPEVVYSQRGAKVRDGLGIGEGHVTLTDEAGLVVAVAILMRRDLQMNTLVFDIETVPDTDLGRRLYDLHDLSDEHVAQIMFTKRREESGSEFLSHEQHRIVAISVVMRAKDSLKVWSLGDENSSEKDLIERFFDGLDKYTPDLVSWNGAGFDLPVLHYRSLLHSVTAARYWELGESDRSFRYSNYLSRFHWRHMDLMDILSGFQGRGRASLQDIASLLGFPGKMGMHGADVWDAYLHGGLNRIRRILRDRCAQHLPDLPAVRTAARATWTRPSTPTRSAASAGC